MQVVFITLLIVGIFYCSANDLRIVKERIHDLENRVNSETKFRRNDYSEMNNRLDETDNYCKISLNNTDKAISGIDKTRKLIVSEVNKTHINLLNEINENSLHDSKQLRDIAIKLEQLKKADDNEISKRVDAIAANVEANKVNIERVYLLLYSIVLDQRSCIWLLDKGITQSGTYQIRRILMVYCDQTTDGGGWIVFQRRLNGEVDFYRNWADYQSGFGDLNGEFWLGNELLSSLTLGGEHELRIEMEDFDGNSVYAKYSKFKIYPKRDSYKLEVSGYSGTAGDALDRHNGKMFSTFDRDNDESSTNCAVQYHGAWWYNNCHHSNLNGKHYNISCSEYDGINWGKSSSSFLTAKKVEMKFR